MIYEDIFLGLGSNIGNNLAYLRKALDEIARLPETKLITFSSVYESAPVGYTDQGNFLNMVAQVATNLPPKQFIEKTQNIENSLGRTRDIRWGPRTLDIDILYWGDQVMADQTLIVPHPQAHNRRFVLLPLCEIASQYQVPLKNCCARDLLEALEDVSFVEVFLDKEKYAIN